MCQFRVQPASLIAHPLDRGDWDGRHDEHPLDRTMVVQAAQTCASMISVNSTRSASERCDLRRDLRAAAALIGTSAVHFIAARLGEREYGAGDADLVVEGGHQGVDAADATGR